MAKWLKNDDVISHTWSGQVIDAGDYYQIEQSRETTFAENDQLLTDIGNGIAVMAIDNSGDTDIQSISSALSYLKNDLTDEKDYDNRSIVHSTPRYRGMITCFSSLEDDKTSNNAVWGGTDKIKYKHTIGDSATSSMYFDFNTIENKSYIFNGYMQWKDADFDEFHCCIVPTTTTYIAGTSTNFTLFGGYLIIPAVGDGDITVDTADMKLVQATPNEYGDIPASYWDADYNSTTKLFENITPNYTGTGSYNLFGVEVPFHKYVESFIMLGSGHCTLSAYDSDMIGHNLRLRFDFVTDLATADHNWQFCGNITMFREKTV